jgi:hypothetical protein
VESKVKDFYIQKTRKPESKQEPKSESQSNPTPQPTETAGAVERFHRAKNKVANASNTSSTALKNVLLQILEKFPQTADIIDENLE